MTHDEPLIKFMFEQNHLKITNNWFMSTNKLASEAIKMR